jgi:heptosyltransferase-2
MHLGSYLDVPIVAIFGPTDEKKYGPWSAKSLAVRKKGLKCAPCEKALCRFNFECMQKLDPKEIIIAAEKILKNV